MTKVVISECYGGFGLSPEASEMYKKLKGLDAPSSTYNFCRHDPDLVHVVETLGGAANTDYSKLVVVEIPSFRYIIDEYDGYESINYPGMDMSWVIVDTPESRSIHPEYFL